MFLKIKENGFQLALKPENENDSCIETGKLIKMTSYLNSKWDSTFHLKKITFQKEHKQTNKYVL